MAARVPAPVPEDEAVLQVETVQGVVPDRILEDASPLRVLAHVPVLALATLFILLVVVVAAVVVICVVVSRHMSSDLPGLPTEDPGTTLNPTTSFPLLFPR